MDILNTIDLANIHASSYSLYGDEASVGVLAIVAGAAIILFAIVFGLTALCARENNE